MDRSGETPSPRLRGEGRGEGRARDCTGTRWWTGSCPSPGSRALRGFRPLPARGERRLAAAITYADFGNEVLVTQSLSLK